MGNVDKTIDRFFDPSCFKKDILTWNYTNGILALTVDRDVVDALFAVAESDERVIDKPSLDLTISNWNGELKRQYDKELKDYEVDVRCLPEEMRLEYYKIPTRPDLPDYSEMVRDNELKTLASRRAFVKSYFLYEFLLDVCNLNGDFTQEMFADSLKDKDESVTTSRNVLEKINYRLFVYYVLYIDKSDHLKTLTHDHKANYKYVFHHLDESIDFPRRTELDTTVFRYDLHGLLKEKVEFISLLQWYKDNTTVKSFQELLAIVKASVGGNYDRRNKKLVQLIKHLSDIERDPKEERTHNDLSATSNSFSFKIYESPYKELELSPIPLDVVAKVGKLPKLKIWLDWHADDVKLTYSSRCWHPFHVLPKEYRKYLTYKGSPLVEAMDVSNCFYTLMTKAMRLSGSINPIELELYEILTGVRPGFDGEKRGRLYEFFEGQFCLDEPPEGWENNDNPFEEAYLSFRRIRKRDRVKIWLQSHRNFVAAGQAWHNHQVLDGVYKHFFPTIRDWMFSYRTYINKDGETKKALQRDMCFVESYIISKVCFRLVNDFQVTPFTLHDGIYLSKHDLEILNTKGVSVNNLFWEEFDNADNATISRILNMDDESPSSFQGRHLLSENQKFDAFWGLVSH